LSHTPVTPGCYNVITDLLKFANNVIRFYPQRPEEWSEKLIPQVETTHLRLLLIQQIPSANPSDLPFYPVRRPHLPTIKLHPYPPLDPIYRRSTVDMVPRATTPCSDITIQDIREIELYALWPASSVYRYHQRISLPLAPEFGTPEFLTY
jgi:hypothetical protein